MMRQEKQIEGVEEDNSFLVDEIDKEESNIKNNFNRDRSNNKKMIIYIVIAILILFVVGLLLFVFLNNNDDDISSNNNINDNEVGEVNGDTDEPSLDVVQDNIGYVSCDDNTSLLNVRNSTTGDIIDGLSCYREVTIEEELDGTDACDKWYKISYEKNGTDYTGYSCGTYIKKLEVSRDVLDNTRNIIDKVNDYYSASEEVVYCGNPGEILKVSFKDGSEGEYVKSSYKNIDELKSYVLSFLDESLTIIKLELSDYDNAKFYDNYYEIDGSLYCRNYSATGLSDKKTGNYDIEIVSNDDNKTIVNVAYQYIAAGSSCNINDLSKCKKSDLVYRISKMNIENGIVTKIN